MKWKDKLIHDLLSKCNDAINSKNALATVINENTANIHLAIFNEPFLSMIFNHTKEIESRFSINQVTPYGKVMKGDLVVMKKSGGDIEGFFKAGDVMYFSNLSRVKIDELNGKYGQKIGWHIDPYFLSNKSEANFLSLIHIGEVYRCKSFTTMKKDRTGWSVVKLGLRHTLFHQDE